MADDQAFLNQAVELARKNLDGGGRPFGALVVRDGEVLATGVNAILSTNDPTSHAELNAIRAAIRAASQRLGSPRLDGCTVYASGHPCPMCMAAMQMTGVREVVYAFSNEDGEPNGLSTASVYTELAKPLAERSMTIRHVPVDAVSSRDLYPYWQERTSSRP
jgi:tRNA(Arg) A34 adenosine deaminase TadA